MRGFCPRGALFLLLLLVISFNIVRGNLLTEEDDEVYDQSEDDYAQTCEASFGEDAGTACKTVSIRPISRINIILRLVRAA